MAPDSDAFWNWLAKGLEGLCGMLADLSAVSERPPAKALTLLAQARQHLERATETTRRRLAKEPT